MEPAAIGNDGKSPASVRSNGIGLLLSIVLTGIAFGLVMSGGAVPAWLRLAGIFGAATIQMLVHLRFFLHLEMTTPDGRWNVLALAITTLILVLFVGGSLWIMFDLDYRMM